MNLLSLFFRTRRLKQDLARAQATYGESKAEYDAAEARGDSRAMGAAWILLKAAKSDLIRAEIALRAARSRKASARLNRSSMRDEQRSFVGKVAR